MLHLKCWFSVLLVFAFLISPRMAFADDGQKQIKEAIQKKVKDAARIIGESGILHDTTVKWISLEGVRWGYDPETDHLPFQVSGEAVDLSEATMEFKDREHQVVDSLPVLFADDGTYYVDVSGIESGMYDVRLTGLPEGFESTWNSCEIPERKPRLTVKLVDESIGQISVGDPFTIRLEIGNRSVVDARDVELGVFTLNQKLESWPPAVQARAGDRSGQNVLTVPLIAAGETMTLALEYKALAATSRLFFSADFVDDQFTRHDDYKLGAGEGIVGSVVGRKTAPQSGDADPHILITEKRWAYCRGRHGEANQPAVKSCARDMARKDFACLKKSSRSAKLACIREIYGP